MENKTVYWICIMLLRHNDADPDPSQQEFKKDFLVAQVPYTTTITNPYPICNTW